MWGLKLLLDYFLFIFIFKYIYLNIYIFQQKEKSAKGMIQMWLAREKSRPKPFTEHFYSYYIWILRIFV